MRIPYESISKLSKFWEHSPNPSLVMFDAVICRLCGENCPGKKKHFKLLLFILSTLFFLDQESVAKHAAVQQSFLHDNSVKEKNVKVKVWHPELFAIAILRKDDDLRWWQHIGRCPVHVDIASAQDSATPKVRNYVSYCINLKRVWTEIRNHQARKNRSY